MITPSDNLQTELLAAGATPAEAAELVRVSQQLQPPRRILRSPLRAAAVLEQILARPRPPAWYQWLTRPVLLGTLATVAFFVLTPLALAQTALPGQPLYPLKRATEAMVTALMPGLRPALSIRRSNEVKELINRNEHRDQVEPTLKAITPLPSAPASATTTAKVKQSLDDAKTHATVAERQAIEQTLKSLEPAPVQPSLPPAGHRSAH